jgi:hypothetical protein
LAVEARSFAQQSDDAAPSLRLARGEDGKVTLAFTPVDGAAEYALRIVAEDGKSEIIPIEVTNYTVQGLKNGRAYRFAVAAVREGRRGPWSNELSATPIDQPGWDVLREAFQSANPTRNSNPFTMVLGNESESELRAIVRAAYDAGFEGLTLHPYNYEDYLGPGQWDRWKIIFDQARRLGLVIWQQDDRNYPSGFAMGKVVSAHPELGRTTLVEAHQQSIDGPKKDFSLDIRPLLQGRDFLAAVSVYPENGEPVDLTDRVADGKLAWDVPAGKWRLFVIKAVWCGPMPVADSNVPMPFVDFMNPRAVDAYIQAIYGATYERFSSEFGRSFKGFFSDEAPVDFAMFTPDFLERFEKSKGYSIRRWLPSVTRDLGPGDKKIRFDYRDFIREEVTTVYFGRAREWCREHGIKLIGHVIEDHLTDMRRLEGLEMPGMDNVFGQWYDPDPDVYWRIPRMTSSVAHYAGSRNDRALAEHFAATGWRTGLSEMKRTMDWTTAMGINEIVPCGLCTQPTPVWEVTPDFWLHGRNPQWPWFSAYQATANRMTMMMRGGRHVAPAIMLDTTESLWAARGTNLQTQHGAADDMWRACAAATQAHVDFDLIPYYVFSDPARTAFDRDKIRIAKEDYRVVILPPVESIPAEVAERLKAFYDAGGVVVAIGRVPASSCNDREDDHVRAAVAAIWGSPGEKRPRSAVVDYGDLENRLVEFDVPDVRIPSQPKNLLYCHRRLHGKDFYFFANAGAEPIEPAIEVRGVRGAPMLWNPVSGEIAEARGYQIEDDAVKLTQPFGEYESLFVVIDPDAKPNNLPAASPTKSFEFAGPWKAAKGTDEYRRVFTAEIRLPDDWPLGSKTRLDFRGASQILRVKVNGQSVGKLFCSPYYFEIGQYLHSGENSIEVERVGRYSSPGDIPNMGGLSFTDDEKALAPCTKAILSTFDEKP